MLRLIGQFIVRIEGGTKVLIRFIVMYIFLYSVTVMLVYHNMKYSGEISFLVLVAAISFLFAKISIIEKYINKYKNLEKNKINHKRQDDKY